MADKWMDERDRDWRERDWRRSEAYGRGGGADRSRLGEAGRYGEERSWADAAEDENERYEELRRRRAAYGEGGPDYGGGSSVAGGGVQPYGAARDYGYARSYRADRDRDERRAWRMEGRGYGREPERFGAYGGSGRSEPAAQESWDERREAAGDFLHRAGERISSWFRGADLMRGGRDEATDGVRRYEEEYRQAARGYRGRGPKGYLRSDERISEDVNDRLTEDLWLDASEIEVMVKAGEVTLSGHVDSRAAKHRAEWLVEDVSGVRHVQNNLRVDAHAGFTGAGRGFGSSAVEAEMRRNELASGAGAAAEQSTMSPTDPKTGPKLS